MRCTFARSKPGSIGIAKREDGIEVYTRDVADSAFKEFRATALVPAPLAEVVAWWRDPSTYTQWINRCAEARRIEVDSGASANYLKFDFPFPVSDRDVVIRARKVEESPKRAPPSTRNRSGVTLSQSITRMTRPSPSLCLRTATVLMTASQSM